MAIELSTGRNVWTDSPLYLFLIDILPNHVKPSGTLNVKKLKADLQRSHERIYQWLRTSRLTPANAMSICALANAPENVEALAKSGRKPPEIRSFDRFVYGD